MLLYTCSASAQKKIYLNSEWEKCSRSRAEYVGIITAEKASKQFDIEVRLYPSMKYWAKGRYTQKKPEINFAVGYVYWYYPDGTLKQKTKFENGLSQGDSWEYHANGEVKLSRHFKDGKLEGQFLEFSEERDTIAIKHFHNDSLHGPLKLFNKGHVLIKSGNYQNGKAHGHFDYYFGKDSLSASGDYNMSKNIGVWKFYHKNGQLASIENYEDDVILSAELFDESGASSPLPDSLSELSSLPEYRGGQEAYMRKLRSLLIYPDKAKEANVQGTVFLVFTIDSEGRVLALKTKGEPLGAGLEEAALESGKNLTDWKPGLNHNRKHPLDVTLPVKFVLK